MVHCYHVTGGAGDDAITLGWWYYHVSKCRPYCCGEWCGYDHYIQHWRYLQLGGTDVLDFHWNFRSVNDALQATDLDLDGFLAYDNSRRPCSG